MKTKKTILEKHDGRKCSCGKMPFIEQEYSKTKLPHYQFRVICKCGKHTIQSTWVPDVKKIWDHGFEIFEGRKARRFFKHRIITDIDRVNAYLERWSVTIPWLKWSVKLHRIQRADDDRCQHDHPWWFWRLILRGGYIETVGEDHRVKKRKPGRISYCPSGFRHRITELRKGDSWSLVLTGPKNDSWGFFTQGGFMPWRKFIEAARSARVLWCDDGERLD